MARFNDDDILESLRALAQVTYQVQSLFENGCHMSEYWQLKKEKLTPALEEAMEILTENQISLDKDEQDDNDAGCDCGHNCPRSPGDGCPRE